MTASFRFLIGAVLAVLLSALFPVDVHAQKIALLHADSATRADAVRTKLIAAGLTDVTVIDVGGGSTTSTTPMLADLQQYQAILTWSNFGYLNPDLLGDTLAQYVDEGGGVVQAAFSFDLSAAGLGGRWDAEQYSVFTSATAVPGFNLIWVATQPTHPILNGTTFAPGFVNYFSPSLLQGGSEAIAHLIHTDDSTFPETITEYPLVATRLGPVGGKIVGLNLFPALGDAGQLMATALQFVAADAVAVPDGPSVALLAAGGASAGADDVRTKLRGLGLFSRVDVIDVSTPVVPTLGTLLQYDALLTWSAANYGNPTGLGDVLADYVDQNRGVVQSVFSFDGGTGLHLEGRWSAEGYRPLTEGPASPVASPLTLLPVVPAHPMLSGVASFSGGTSSYHNTAELDGATTLVAMWSDGQPFVAFGTKPAGGRVVALNMFPPSSDAAADLWDATTDGARLIGNALMFAANHFPTANAGADQTGEAASPAGVAFTINATGADLDDDALSFNWSGAVTATGEAIEVNVPPPPAPQQSHTVTVTLTVADGKGGETTDSVELTVTDMVGPVLQNVPSGILTSDATDASGAEVAYGPVTAADAVDGDVPVTCSHSGVFPIGDTLVTCSASDTRGNTAEQTFTVRVVGTSSAGEMHGAGFLRANNRRHEFAFHVRESESGVERGRVYLRSRGIRFVSRSVDYVWFNGDSVVFRGSGSWNGAAGYRYEVAADDNSELSTRDRVRITITAPDGTVVAQLEGMVRGGNVRCFRDRH